MDDRDIEHEKRKAANARWVRWRLSREPGEPEATDRRAAVLIGHATRIVRKEEGRGRKFAG
jgi:hypothetical protein